MWKVGEAIGLLRALKWAEEMQIFDIDFEMDCKRIVNGLYNKRIYCSERIVELFKHQIL
jgi:ribonuclease HI